MKASLHKETGEKMNVYEVGYLITPSVPEEKIPEEVGVLRAVIERNGGAVLSEEFPQLMDLAYTMYQSLEASKAPFKEAYFGSFKFEMPTASVTTLEKELTAHKNLLRFLFVKTLAGNTMYTEKVAKKEDEAETATPAASSEIDKSIDALVIS